MRIAIIGAHCTGKSTLARDFLRAAPGYAFEPEPYETMIETGEEFGDPPGRDDMIRQLQLSITTIWRRADDQDVLFERAPMDLAAYCEVLGEAEGAGLPDDLRDEAIDAMRLLDLVVFLPIGRPDRLAVMEPELPRLRLKVDRRLKELVRDDSWEIFARGEPRLIEIDGSPATRLQLLTDAVGG